MKVKDLKEAVNGISMNDEMQKKIIKNVKSQTNGKQKISSPHHWSKTATAAAIVIAVLGIAAFPVKAFVNSLVQERMEKIPEEEIISIADKVENQTEEADSYSREYTAGEQTRYQKLYQQYQNGVFPENEIPQADSEEAADKYEFCYLTPAGRFCLPERELTDEELMEIIDFILKREYAVNQNCEKEHAEEIAQEKELKKAAITANVENGGITEQQAAETASALLPEFYGITGEGMEFNHYYDGGDNQPALQEQAADFMWEKLKTSYEKEYIYYLTYNDGTTTRYAKFIFEKGDGAPVKYLISGMVLSPVMKKLTWRIMKTEKQFPGLQKTEQKKQKQFSDLYLPVKSKAPARQMPGPAKDLFSKVQPCCFLRILSQKGG